MIQVILQSIIFFVISIPFALICRDVFKLQFYNPIKQIMVGVFVITLVSRVVYFFFPINQYYFYCLCFITILFYTFNFNKVKYFLKEIWLLIYEKKWILFFIFFSLSYLCSLRSITFDEGLYHSGFISWINHFKIIKGLANVHDRFGYNSNWHLLAAVFNGYGIFNIEANGIINLCFIFLFCLYFIIEGNLSKCYIYYLAIPFLFFPLLLVYQLVAPAVDLIIIFFILVLLLEIIVYIEKKHSNTFENLKFWACILPNLFALKINSVTIIIPLVFYIIIIYKRKELSKIYFLNLITIFLIFILIVIIPLIISNIIISGYYFYPFLKQNLFQLKWQIPQTIAQENIRGIQLTPLARWSHTNNLFELDKLNKIQQIILFFKKARIIEKIIFIIFFICPIIYTLINKTIKEKILGLLLLSFYILHLFLVPDLRFMAASGYISVIVLSYHLLKKYYQYNFLKLIWYVSFIQIGLTILLYFYWYPKILNEKKIPQNAYFSFTAKIPYQIKGIDTIKTSHPSIVYYHSNPEVNYFCWNIIPCFQVNSDTSYFKLIDNNNIEAGFYK